MNSNRKTLYVSDLDGTLLNHQSVVSQNSAAMLNEAINSHGALFTVATARTPATAVPLLSAIDLKLPAIVMAGAALWDNKNGGYTHSCPIDEDTVQHVCRIYEENGIHPFVYRLHGKILKAYHHSALISCEKTFVRERMHSKLKQFVINDTPYINLDNNPALLIFSTNDYNRLKTIDSHIACENLHCHPICYHDIFDVRYGNLEIYAPSVSKAAAITTLRQSLHADRLVVFGDNLNDIEMMRLADRCVAPGNAIDEIKAIAHEIIDNNDTDSVARYILHDAKQYS